jgi:hypothetical protein
MKRKFMDEEREKREKEIKTLVVPGLLLLLLGRCEVWDRTVRRKLLTRCP